MYVSMLMHTCMRQNTWKSLEHATAMLLPMQVMHNQTDMTNLTREVMLQVSDPNFVSHGILTIFVHMTYIRIQTHACMHMQSTSHAHVCPACTFVCIICIMKMRIHSGTRMYVL